MDLLYGFGNAMIPDVNYREYTPRSRYILAVSSPSLVIGTQGNELATEITIRVGLYVRRLHALYVQHKL